MSAPRSCGVAALRLKVKSPLAPLSLRMERSAASPRSTSHKLTVAIQRTVMEKLRVCIVALCCVVCTFAYAQGYPVRPVRIIVPFSAGSGSDVFARTLGPKFTDAWGQQIVVENREGAGGMIGAEAVAKATPDGYTLLLAATPWAVSPSLYAKPPYDPLRDFAPVGRIGFVPSVLVVHPSMP